MANLQALLWDVDGTLAETERDGHLAAFNEAFQSAGLSWHWNEARYGELLAVTGGRERLLHDMGSRPDAPATSNEREALARALHQQKNHLYAEHVRTGRVPLRPGVAELIEEALSDGLRLAIVTTTSRVNVQALMAAHFGPSWAARWASVVCGEDVQQKKPDSQAYHLALRQLQLQPQEAVAIEDSPGGVAAACGAELPVVVTLSAYFARATIGGAVAIGPGLHTRQGWRPALRGAEGRVDLDDIRAWCAERDTVSQAF